MKLATGGTGKAAMGFILLLALLDAVSMGLIYPILPQLVIDLSGGDTPHASRIFGLLAAAWAVMNFVAAPILGTLSDRFGRRPVILISAFGLAIDLVIMALAQNLAWLFIGRLLSGVTAASYATISAYLADVTPPEQRARRFGLLSGIFGIGLILGPAAGGLLAEISLRAPFWVAAVLTAFGWLYGLLVLPESLPAERRARLSWHAANPVKSFGVLTRYEGLSGLSAMAMLVQLAAQAVNTLFMLYTAHRYGWTPVQVGLLLMVYSAGTIVMVAALSPFLVSRFRERKVVLGGLLCLVVGFLGLAVAPTGFWFAAACAVICLGNVATPPLQALLTHKVGADEQGRLQGALSALMALTGMVGPILFTQIFAWSISGNAVPAMSGIALAVGAFMAALAWLLALKVARSPKAEKMPSAEDAAATAAGMMPS
ncbi:TCR/Tet family MFS transporter [Sphingosinicella rhizophila]|uniref:TCR/Tet family MFS transporter n=1 Tax=Sphingosinicella rhizophila TaxID=3050082 RepID=A0ABU3Q9D7_9SPHN|nr:TCR/Tet family MFS transporter [Sphingosinicella sp. GR2756]MDT9599719.1 TCR/Tet family MFS transporter [Sphingosinicella sp. GR2756]